MATVRSPLRDEVEGLVPPRQCPECGRFLSNAFVTSLQEGSQPCPGCDHALDDTMFAEPPPAGRPAQVPAAAPVDESDDEPGGAFETAPDGKPADDRGDEAPDDDDVLAGWDLDADDAARESLAQPPFPADTVWVAAAAGIGGLFGVLVAVRRMRGAVLGSLLGALVAAIVRRLWRLED